ncbi:MAG: hypothetical protein PHH37_11605 [Paludibacter sp.]|nr:hypothetical protein [Paludibacter sp.]
MKKTLLFHALCMLFFLLPFTINAQTLVASWEAEDYVGLGLKPDVANYPLVASVDHSGGYYIQRISKSQSAIYFVNLATEGVYELKIFYMIAADGGQIGSNIGVRVNNQVIRGVTVTDYTDTDNSTVTKSITYPIYLDAGVNMIRIGQNKKYFSSEGYTPNIDKFELYTSEESLDKPDDDADYANQAELNTYSGLDGYTAIFDTYKNLSATDLYTVTSESSNSTIGNLADGNNATKFISTNDEETITLYFPHGSGFALRNLVFDNSEVTLSSHTIQRSTDGITWENMPAANVFLSLYYSNAGTACGGWQATTESTYDYKYYRFTIKKIPGASGIEIGDMKIYGLYQGLQDLTESANGSISTSLAAGDVEGGLPNGLNQAIDNDGKLKFVAKNNATLNIM